MLDFLRERFETRFRNIESKAKKFNLQMPDKESLWNLLKKKYEENFTCEYCHQPLEIKDEKYPYLKSFSFDHKKSCFAGGDNNITNFAIVCHECNIIKGTMDAETFKQIIKYLPKELRLKMFQANYGARLANKLEREKQVTLEHDLWNISEKYQDTFYLPPTCPKCMKPLSHFFGTKNKQVCTNCQTTYEVSEITP